MQTLVTEGKSTFICVNGDSVPSREHALPRLSSPESSAVAFNVKNNTCAFPALKNQHLQPKTSAVSRSGLSAYIYTQYVGLYVKLLLLLHYFLTLLSSKIRTCVCKLWSNVFHLWIKPSILTAAHMRRPLTVITAWARCSPSSTDGIISG